MLTNGSGNGRAPGINSGIVFNLVLRRTEGAKLVTANRSVACCA
jgi:hypothetical protein